MARDVRVGVEKGVVYGIVSGNFVHKIVIFQTGFHLLVSGTLSLADLMWRVLRISPGIIVSEYLIIVAGWTGRVVV